MEKMCDLFNWYATHLYRGIPICVYESLLFLLCFGVVILIAIKGFGKGKRALIGLLVVEYVVLIYCSTVFFRKDMEASGHNLNLFWSYEAINKGKYDILAESIMNVVVFVPVGLLFSCVSIRLKWWMVLMIGFGISLSIEIMQYVFKRGFAEFDDLFHNTLGCAIGIMIMALMKGIWKFCSYVFVPQWGRRRRAAV